MIRPISVTWLPVLHSRIPTRRLLQDCTCSLMVYIQVYVIQYAFIHIMFALDIDKTKDDVIRQHHLAKKLLMLFLESELTRLSVWCNPLNSLGHGNPACFTGSTEKSMVMDESWKEIVRFAWELSPRLAVQMNQRFVQPIVHRELHRLIANNTLDVVDVPEALVILLGDRLLPNAKLDLKVYMT